MAVFKYLLVVCMDGVVEGLKVHGVSQRRPIDFVAGWAGSFLVLVLDGRCPGCGSQGGENPGEFHGDGRRHWM